MIPAAPTITIPLHTDEEGVIHVGKSRVRLEQIIHAYYLGETPEGIVDSFPSLTTSDVYAVVAYYLANRQAVDAYVRQRDEQVEQIIHDMQSNLTPEARDLRTRLRAYKDDQKKHQ